MVIHDAVHQGGNKLTELVRMTQPEHMAQFVRGDAANVFSFPELATTERIPLPGGIEDDVRLLDEILVLEGAIRPRARPSARLAQPKRCRISR
jgi:hypothetical protein